MPSFPTSPTVADRFFVPLDQFLPNCEHTRLCHALPDSDWLRLLVGRGLHQVPSGRAFLQEFAHRFPVAPDTGAFFESLKSTRRLKLLKELNRQLQQFLGEKRADPLAQYPVLNNFDLFAGDGHFHAAAAHDPAVEGTKYATGHLYGLNLRHTGVVHLTTGDRVARRKEHDMRALKRLDIEALRQGAPQGRQVIWVWDRAGIDFRQWYDWKHGSGIYFISRAKEGQADDVLGERSWERSDPINQGVIADQLVGSFSGVLIRRITYRDPVDGEILVFLTNEMSLPPGLVAHLYRMRWDLEKVFDEFKNKLGAHQSWASTPTAKSIQAQCLCLAHALLVLFETLVVEGAGIRNGAEEARRQKRLHELEERLTSIGESLPQAIRQLLRCTQHSVKLIRWLRSSLFLSTSCGAALERLRELYRIS